MKKKTNLNTWNIFTRELVFAEYKCYFLVDLVRKLPPTSAKVSGSTLVMVGVSLPFFLLFFFIPTIKSLNHKRACFWLEISSLVHFKYIAAT